MKELASKFLKFVGASVGILVGAYTIGWSGAVTLHSLFKTEKAEAIQFVNERIYETKQEFMAIRQADLDGINGKINILIDQNKLIISQNYRTRKAVEKIGDNE